MLKKVDLLEDDDAVFWQNQAQLEALSSRVDTMHRVILRQQKQLGECLDLLRALQNAFRFVSITGVDISDRDAEDIELEEEIKAGMTK